MRAIPFDPKLVATSEHHCGVRFKSSMVEDLRFDNALHKWTWKNVTRTRREEGIQKKKKPKNERANKERVKHTTNGHDVRTTTAEHGDGDAVRRLHRRVGGGGGGAHGIRRRHMVIT